MFLTRRISFFSLMLKVYVLAALLLPWAACGGFVDMDTPLDKRTTKSLVDNTVYHLVGFEDDPRKSNVGFMNEVEGNVLMWQNELIHCCFVYVLYGVDVTCPTVLLLLFS